jgi:hypothetical protein
MRSLVPLLFVCLVATGSLGAPRTAPKTENVILITFDGLRWQEVFSGADPLLMNKTNGNVGDTNALKRAFWSETPEARREALLPFLWAIVAKQGQIFGNTNRSSVVRVTNGKKFSYPGYSELLCGVADSRISSNDKTNNPNLNVLEWLHGKPAFRGRVAAFCSWDVFPFILSRSRNGLLVNAGVEPIEGPSLTVRERFLNQLMTEATPLWEGIRQDVFTFHAALEHFKKRKPRLLYVAFDETDDWAHDGRYDRYLHAAHHIDGFMRILWDTAQSMRQYRGKTTLIISTDHGRGPAPKEWRNHGENTLGAEYIWLAAMGPDTPALGERANVKPLAQAQIASTIAALLGEDYCVALPHVAKPITDLLPAAGTPASASAR